MMPLVVDNAGVGTAGGLSVIPTETGGGFNSLFLASGREFKSNPSKHARNAATIFVRGYKDRVLLTVSGGSSWTWRRIVFAFKGPRIRNFWSDNTLGEQYWGLGSGSGSATARTIGPMPDQIATQIRDLLYRGSAQVDWYDPFSASIDTTRVTLFSDTTHSINPTNESGRTRSFNLWTPINKNLNYDGFEQEEGKVSRPYSTEGKPGIGDIYIFDQVRRDTPLASGAPLSEMVFSPEGTFYWHER